MGYIDKNLLSGERVLYRANLHWIVFIWPAIWLALSIQMFITGHEAVAFGGIAITLAVITGIVALINYTTSEFGITNKRVIAKVGFIRRNSMEVLLNKVEGIQVNQGILGRVLGYGSIVISGTGGTKDPFRRISTPLEFRRVAQAQIANAQEGR